VRILNLINVRWYNATAWYAVRASIALKKRGHEIILCGLPDTPPVLKAEEAGLETFEARFNNSSPANIISVASRINSLIRDFKPDVVMCNRGEFFWYFALRHLLWTPNWKLVRVRGDIRPPKKDFFNKIMHKWGADLVISSGEFIREKFVKNLKVPEWKTSVIYGGVDADRFKPDKESGLKVRDEYGISEDDFVVGIVGRFDPIKGHENLIKAVSELYHKRDKKNIRLLIAGFDAVSTTAVIKVYLKDADIEDISFITGQRDDIEAVINALDLGVVSSLGSEAICRVGMEIMSCEVPLVVSDTGVLPEIVPPENVYPKKDWKALADKIENHSKETTLFSEERFGYLIENELNALLNR